MRMSWRTSVFVLLFAAWPQLGCVQVPGDKSVQDLRPVQPKAGAAPKVELTAADITKNWHMQADLLERTGKTKDAIALCEKMREPGNPQAAAATKKLAQLHLRSGDLERAEQEFRLLLQQNPSDADILNSLGEISYRRGHWGTAEQMFGYALRNQPDHAYARINLGMTLAQQGKKDESIEAFTRVLSKAEAYCELGFILKLQGKRQDALQAYQAALSLEPTLERARTEMAVLMQAMMTDPPAATKVTVTTHHNTGLVDLERASAQTSEGASRLLMQRPTLPPLPDLNGPAGNDWPSSASKR